jgi:hypothetical protein
MARDLAGVIRHLSSVIQFPVIRHLSSVILLLFFSLPLRAQTVKGTLRDQTSHAPIADALVQLLGDRDQVHARGTTSARGEYLLRGPRDGVYRIRVLRIGFRPWISDSVTLRSAEITLRVDEIDPGVVVLAELTVTAKSACRRSPAEDAKMEAVWQQARTTLALVEAGGQDEIEFRVLTRDRTLDKFERQLQELTSHTYGRGAWPVKSLDAESLATNGFIQMRDTLEGPVYYGPDVAVFFSDAFLTSHCFRLLPGPKDESDLIGLGFEPLGGRKVADIQGVLWLHRRDGLSRLEYGYTGMPPWVPKGTAGGVLRFDRLSVGRPIITGWSLQAPIAWVDGKRMGLHGYRQLVGEVEEVRQSSRELLWRRAPT